MNNFDLFVRLMLFTIILLGIAVVIFSCRKLSLCDGLQDDPMDSNYYYERRNLRDFYQRRYRRLDLERQCDRVANEDSFIEREAFA